MPSTGIERSLRPRRIRAGWVLVAGSLVAMALFASTARELRGQSAVVGEIEAQFERCRELLREGQRYGEALSLLAPLTAKIFGVEDKGKQMELAADLFLLRGIALAGTGDDPGAVREFQSLFALSPDLAKAASKNIYDPRIIALLRKAEGRPQETPIEPREAPPLASSQQSAALAVRSRPSGARILLDGTDSGLVTDGSLSGLTPGPHSIKLVKDLYADWETKVQIPPRGVPPAVDAVLFAVSYESIGTWGGPETKRFSALGGLAVDRQDRIFVLDGGTIKVTLFNSDGESQALTPADSADLGEMIRPSGLAVDGTGKAYLADAETHYLYTVGPDGQVISKWGGMGGSPKDFNTPMGLAVDAQDNLYVADLGNGRILKFSAHGEFLKLFIPPGDSSPQSFAPRAVAVNRAGEVFALDSGRIIKFSSGGIVLATFGKAGAGEGEFDNPLGLGLDDDGCLYVADTGNQRIQKFDGQGRFLCSWGGPGREPGLMDTPCALAVGRNGVVYVAERGNQRIQLFTVGSGALGTSR
jgi:DNA-binding beta-propeller fold protein YncE